MAKRRQGEGYPARDYGKADKRWLELDFQPALGSDKDGRGKYDEDGNRRIKKLPGGP